MAGTAKSPAVFAARQVAEQYGLWNAAHDLHRLAMRLMWEDLIFGRLCPATCGTAKYTIHVAPPASGG